MDETVMLVWVDQVLRPYVESAPEDIIPILILDSYRCHMMASVVQKIQELGWRSSTSQEDAPPSVSLSTSALIFRSRTAFGGCGQWTEWMISKGIANGTTSTPTRLKVATWVDQAMADMSAKRGIMRNAWLKSGYEWVELVGGVEEEGLI